MQNKDRTSGKALSKEKTDEKVVYGYCRVSTERQDLQLEIGM